MTADDRGSDRKELAVGSPLAGGVAPFRRGRRAEPLATGLDVLVDAGIRSLEVTLNTPGALEAIRRARTRFGEEVSVGAGTVRTVADVEDAVAAGAQFLVSPHTDPALGARARELSAAYLPGALTPTEIVTAWNSGAAAVKLFPARLGGPRYLRDLREPLPDIPIVPTGGGRAGEGGGGVAPRAGARRGGGGAGWGAAGGGGPDPPPPPPRPPA